MTIQGMESIIQAVFMSFCPWAVRPAERCPAAGEGLRGRQRRSAVKLTPMIMFYGLAVPYCWQRTKFQTSRRHICGWQDGPYMLFTGFFFYWPESGFLVKNRRARVTSGCRRHSGLSNSATS